MRDILESGACIDFLVLFSFGQSFCFERGLGRVIEFGEFLSLVCLTLPDVEVLRNLEVSVFGEYLHRRPLAGNQPLHQWVGLSHVAVGRNIARGASLELSAA